MRAHYHLAARLLSHPEPLDAATSAHLEAEAMMDDYLRDLRRELDDLEKSYRTRVVDKLVANFFGRASRNRPMRDREFERRREILVLIMPYATLSQMIAAARGELDAGKVPSAMGIIRTAVGAIKLVCREWLDRMFERQYLTAQQPRPMSTKKSAERAQGQQAVVDRLSDSEYLEQPNGNRIQVWGKLHDRRVQLEIRKAAAKECGVNLKTIKNNTVVPKIVHKLER